MKRSCLTLLVPLLLPLLGAGCGFHPLYGGGEDSAISKLPDIFVAPIPERSGQELRLALQQRLAGTSDAQPTGYTLVASYSAAGEAIGIHGDNTSERTRLVGRAHWTLFTVAPVPVQIATGDTTTMDGYNNINEEYFASGIASDTTQQRIANALADAVTTQIATWFTNHQAPATAHDVVPPNKTLSPGNVPGNSDQSPLTTVGPDGLPASATGRLPMNP
jgi:LPS-assembly lipoprotein